MILLSKDTKSNLWITAGDLKPSSRCLPDSVVPAFRKKQPYISGYLSKNEVKRQGPYNYQLFKRIKRGYYIINPGLKIKVGSHWCQLQSPHH